MFSTANRCGAVQSAGAYLQIQRYGMKPNQGHSCFLPVFFLSFLIATHTVALCGDHPNGPFRRAIAAVILDSKSGSFLDMRPEQLQVSGVAAAAIRCEKLSGPRRILMLLDVGPNSWISEVRRKNTFGAAKHFVRQCGMEDSLALHVFGKTHQVLVPFSRDPSHIPQEIDRVSLKSDKEMLKEFGRSADVLRGLRASLEAVKADLRFGDAIVLISTGAFLDLNRKELQSIHLELIGLGVRLYLLRTMDLVQPQMVLQQMPANTVPYDIAMDSGLDRIRRIIQEQEALIFPTGGDIMTPRGEGSAVVGHQDIPMGDLGQFFKTEWIAGAANSVIAMIRHAYKIELEVRESVTRPRRFVLKTGDGKSAVGQKIQVQHAQWILPASPVRRE